MEAMCHTPRERKSKSLDKGSYSMGREGKMRKRKEGKGKKGKKGKGGSHFPGFVSCLREERRRGKEE